jgi:hypothetical protein
VELGHIKHFRHKLYTRIFIAPAPKAGAMAKKLFDRLCRDCECWYGNEDEEYGPCTVKHRRGDRRYVTHGSHKCDEVVEDDQQAPCKG